MKKTEINELPCCCEFCEHSSPLADKVNFLCDYKGVVSGNYQCKKFFYDPLKRVPKPAPTLPTLTKEDLLL